MCSILRDIILGEYFKLELYFSGFGTTHQITSFGD